MGFRISGQKHQRCQCVCEDVPALLSRTDRVALGRHLLSLSASSGNGEPDTHHPLSKESRGRGAELLSGTLKCSGSKTVSPFS